MARKKTQDTLDDIMMDSSVAAEPVPVKVVQEPRPNPWIGKFPMEGEKLPSRRYRFVHNQQPGTPLEATPGLTFLSKGTGRPKPVDYKINWEDGEEYEIPDAIVEKLQGLVYSENGQNRPRFTFIPV